MELSKAEFSFDYDGDDFNVVVERNSLRGCCWAPTGRTVDFVVVFVHDIGSFVTQNHDIFDVFVNHGGAVYACDHLGHGRSQGPRLGLTINNIIKETSAVLQYVLSQYPGVPIYLYGQEAGALAIMSFILGKAQNWDVVSGVVLESPWLVKWVQRDVGIFETSLLLLMDKIFPNYIFDLGFTRYTNETAPKYIDMSEKCPLYFPYMTPKFYVSAMQAITDVRMSIDTWPSSVQMFIAVGRDDTVLDSEALIEFINSLKLTIKVFDGRVYSCGHLITKGRERPSFLKDVISFFTEPHKKR